MKHIGYALAAAWLVAILIAATVFRAPLEMSLIVPRPIDPLTFAANDILLGLMSTVIDVSVFTLMILVAGGIGGVLIEDAPSPAEYVAYRVLLGLLIMTLVLLGLGLAGLFPSRITAWVGLVISAGSLWRYIWRWWQDLRYVLRELVAPTESALVRWLRLGVLLSLAMVGILAVSPPTAWDALMYHLAGGREYLAMGHIGPLADNYRLSLPNFSAILYTWPQILASADGAALFNWGAGIVMLLIVFGALQRLDDKMIAPEDRPLAFWVTCILILATSTLHHQMAVAYADVIATAFAAGAVMLLTAQPTTHRLILAGVFTGAIMGVRVTGFPITIAIAVLTVWQARQGGLSRMGRNLAIVVVMAVVTFSPWILKNIIVEGNPIAPFGAGGALYPASEVAFEQSLFNEGGLTRNTRLFLPIQAIFGVEGFNPFHSSLNAVIVGLLPVFLLNWKHRSDVQRRTLTQWLVFCVALYIVWHGLAFVLPNFSRLRYISPLLVILPLAEAVALITLPRPANAINLKAFGLGTTTISLVLGVLLTGAHFFTTQPLPVVVGLEPRDAYLSRQLGGHYSAMQALPDNSLTVLLWEPRGFYCLPDCITDDALSTWTVALAEHGSTEAVIETWADEGITHVLVYVRGARFVIDTEGSPLSEDDFAALIDLEGETLTQVYQNDQYILYDILGGSDR